MQAREPPQGAHPPAHAARKASRLGRRNLAMRGGIERGAQRLLEVLAGRQRLDLDAEDFGRIDCGAGRRQ
jgi:hypothetical protein